jgi:cell division protein FtsI/penicillin-binding protein 2
LAVTAGLAGLWKAAPRHDSASAKVEYVKPAVPGEVRYPGKLPAKVMVDPFLQAFAEDVIRRHPTRLAAIYVMDMATRRTLVALVGENGKARVDLPSLATPQYPMASLAKMTTAWAAFNDKGIAPSKRFHLRGKPHTLLRGQLDTVRGDTISLARAFAMSANPIFGQIGVHYIGASRYMQWLDTMGFNRPQGLGEGVPAGRAQAPRDSYNLAELASGFVRTTFISPIHAAMLVRKYAGGGELLPPCWDSAGAPRKPVAEETKATREMLEIMRLTADSGTARRAFEQVWEDEMREGFEFGGKTGSLDGETPKGHYEWFAGFARRKGRPDSGIAVAALAVNEGRQLLPGNWFAVQVLGAWRRHFGESRPAMSSDLALAGGTRYFSEDDQQALKDRPTFRPVKRRGGKKGRKGRKTKPVKAAKKRRKHRSST